ncbi:hypothetical protein [Empedobacter brevis]|uniref:hypothetical protein n=1 Tax=Empedobacter brevis TaxID=247 RepID=UPI002FE10C53
MHKINYFEEIELDTGLKHGFLYKALDEWIESDKKWAQRNYERNEVFFLTKFITIL